MHAFTLLSRNDKSFSAQLLSWNTAHISSRELAELKITRRAHGSSHSSLYMKMYPESFPSLSHSPVTRIILMFSLMDHFKYTSTIVS